jgi:transposase-like protein
LVLSIMEMYVQGVSTRKVTEITEQLCGTSFSKSTVSQLDYVHIML